MCIFILVFLLIASSVSAQDSASADEFSFKPRVSWDISAGHYYQSRSGYRIVTVDQNLSSSENSNVTDNPLFHGAAFAQLQANVFITDGVTAKADIIAEHRGISYGVYNTRSMIVYPRITFTVDTNFSLAEEKFKVFGSVGNFNDIRVQEGLNFYNMDGQGTNVSLQWKYIKLAYLKIGDLVNWYGLNIDDVNERTISLEQLPVVEGLTLDMRAGAFVYGQVYGRSSGPNDGYNFSAGLEYSEKVRLYGQLGMRGGFNVDGRSAFVMGITGSHQSTWWDGDARFEYRSYGADYNSNYINKNVSFRKKGLGDYNNTIGESLYPIFFYDRPFSQWSVLTEYQMQNISMLTLQLHGKLFFFKRFFIGGQADLNLLSLPDSQNKSFLYSFYDIGIGWEPVKNTSVKVSYSNRAMNLDKHYPTLYMYSQPAMNMMLRWNY